VALPIDLTSMHDDQSARSHRVDNSPDLRFSRLHPSWEALIRYCEQLQFGELEKVRIQNGLPMTVEVVRTKMRLSE
jgi:hypothetical protein